MNRQFYLAAILICLSALLLPTQCMRAQQRATVGPSEITVGGDVTTPLTVSAADLKTMPRMTVRVDNAHNHKTEVYEGVAIAALLEKAGVPHGEQIRGKWMAAYVLVEAADNYRVLFSLPELDSAFLDSNVIVADTLDAAPMGAGEGPFKLVAPHEKRPARWVRMVKSITVVHLPDEGR